MESGRLCVFALLSCSGPQNPHSSHGLGSKIAHMSWERSRCPYPEKQMFCLSLVCQSYDLEHDGFCSSSRWFMGKAADLFIIPEVFKVEEAVSSNYSFCFFACSILVSLQLLSNQGSSTEAAEVCEEITGSEKLSKFPL